MNVIARLEFELACYDFVNHSFNHYTTETPQGCIKYHFKSLTRTEIKPSLFINVLKPMNSVLTSKLCTYDAKLNYLKKKKKTNCFDISVYCPVGWGCRIHRLHLCRGVRHPSNNECPWYDTKQSDGEKSWNFCECGVPLHCHLSPVHSGRSGSICSDPIYGSNRTKLCSYAKLNCLK